MPFYPICLSCLLHLRCWVNAGAIAATNNWVLFHRDAYGTVQNSHATLCSLANNLERKVATETIRWKWLLLEHSNTQFPRGSWLPCTGNATVSWAAASHLPQALQSWKLTWEFLPPFYLQVKAKGFWEDQESISYGKPLAQETFDLNVSEPQGRSWYRSTGMWACILNSG